ncbi:MAG: hypothetical protein QF704_10020, partial [Anaerolineales bacterium]|nr:hypothetical protein [Anaerolineales bacterium]
MRLEDIFNTGTKAPQPMMEENTYGSENRTVGPVDMPESIWAGLRLNYDPMFNPNFDPNAIGPQMQDASRRFGG